MEEAAWKESHGFHVNNMRNMGGIWIRRLLWLLCAKIWWGREEMHCAEGDTSRVLLLFFFLFYECERGIPNMIGRLGFSLAIQSCYTY